jgi:hypothetical protein
VAPDGPGSRSGCPWCGAPRVAEPSCPRCGANYAKAELIRAQGRAPAAALAAALPVAEPAVAAVMSGPDDAASAWLCGYLAVPTLWKTLIPDSRGFVAPLALAAALVTMMVRAWRAEKTALVVLGAALLAVQAIGAAAFVDMSATWWTALGNAGAIPFGENEGTGLSDPLRLLEQYHWSEEAIVRRYVAVSAASLLALSSVYAWGVLRARRAKG